MNQRTHPVTHRLLSILMLAGVVLAAGCSDDDSPTLPPVGPTYLYVDQAAGAPDGAGTKGDPLDTIQAGIALAAAGGHHLRVAAGIYTVNSATGSALAMDPAVSLYGGFANEDGTWTRDPETHVTTLRDLAAAGGTYDSPRRAVTCVYGVVAADPPVIDGFRIEGGGGDLSTGIFVSEGSSVTVNRCVFQVGTATDASGLRNFSTNRDSGTLITVSDCTIGGGGGSQVVGIQVSRCDLTVTGTLIDGLTATNRVFAIDCGYGDILITDSVINGGSAPNGTRGLYLNEAFTSTVSGCTIHGGSGGSHSYGIQAMDTEGVSSISGNHIDAGTGTLCIALELGWVEVNPSVDGNVFRASGGTDRYGVYETDNTADPVSLTGNVFGGSLLAGAGTGVFYHDMTGGTMTDIADIADLNALDDTGLNPAGSVSGNTVLTE